MKSAALLEAAEAAWAETPSQSILTKAAMHSYLEVTGGVARPPQLTTAQIRALDPHAGRVYRDWRLVWNNNPPFAAGREAGRLVDMIDAMLNANLGAPSQSYENFTLHGEVMCGKTSTMLQALKTLYDGRLKNEPTFGGRTQADRETNEYLPIVYYGLQHDTGPTGFLNGLIDYLGIPVAAKADNNERARAIGKTLTKCGTAVVAIDDLDQFTEKYTRYDINSTLKGLTAACDAVFVLCAVDADTVSAFNGAGEKNTKGNARHAGQVVRRGAETVGGPVILRRDNLKMLTRRLEAYDKHVVLANHVEGHLTHLAPAMYELLDGANPDGSRLAKSGVLPGQVYGLLRRYAEFAMGPLPGKAVGPEQITHDTLVNVSRLPAPTKKSAKK